MITAEDLAVGWLLAGYRFDRYRGEAPERPGPARLVLDPPPAALAVAEGVWFARSLVDTPSEDMGPEELEEVARDLAAAFDGRLVVVRGEALRTGGFPLVWAVGRASPREPRVLDLVFGPEDAPKITLVGKGVCFDTGGLDLKPPQLMRLMKKDMGGAAVVLGLARALLAAGIRARLRVIVPALDNAVSGAAFRPGDVLRSRRGLTVEVGNTDAEGRLALADALAAADEEDPALLVDVATLTGAARVALGPDLPALFTPDDVLAAELLEAGRQTAEPLWRLPLHAPYGEFLESRIADIDNAGEGRHAGAITAALFLQRFVSPGRAWAHLDVYCWNDRVRPGRPKGGEASALRPLFAAISRRLEEGRP
ncbi:Peptidase B [bacterium HR39]|nr:Peptidase B [bacterium HR39]